MGTLHAQKPRSVNFSIMGTLHAQKIEKCKRFSFWAQPTLSDLFYFFQFSFQAVLLAFSNLYSDVKARESWGSLSLC